MGKILLVDDDEGMRTTVARILRSAGHVVTLATDGTECLPLYRSSSADLVVMDLFMPDKDGLEALVELREEFPRVAVVAMSGHRPNVPEGTQVTQEDHEYWPAELKAYENEKECLIGKMCKEPEHAKQFAARLDNVVNPQILAAERSIPKRK